MAPPRHLWHLVSQDAGCKDSFPKKESYKKAGEAPHIATTTVLLCRPRHSATILAGPLSAKRSPVVSSRLLAPARNH